MTGASVTMTGRLTADPVLRSTAAGLPVANFSLAHTPRKQDEKGNWDDAGEPLFLRVTCWRAIADNAAATLHKGDMVTVTGKLGVRSYTNEAGASRTELTCDADSVAVDLRFQTASVMRVVAAGAADPSAVAAA